MGNESDSVGNEVELYRRLRPRRWKDLIGQEAVVKALAEKVVSGTVPHAILLVGPSGTGKTTVARILKAKMGCSDHDFAEINCAADGSIDTVRDIRSRMNLAPVAGACRMWLLDEFQSLSRAGFAQQAMLKMLEDTPSHVYFLLAATDDSKIIPTIKTRTTIYKFAALPVRKIRELLTSVCGKESATLGSIGSGVLDKIAEIAEGSARKALVVLHQISGLGTDAERMEAVEKADVAKQAIDLARCLMKPGTKWKDAAAILAACDEDPEAVRRLVLGYARSVLLKNSQPKAYAVICAFEGNFFDSGAAGLARACWEVLSDSR